MLNFLGIGAQKAGTTWLYRQLSAHPRIAFPGGKEVHYWNSRRHKLPESWYIELFNTSNGQVNGDITPAYSTLDLETIRRIGTLFPHVAIIFILRNPIDRAWSAALMAMKRAELEVHEVSDQWFLDHFDSRGSRLRSDYERTLKQWLHVFPRDRLMLLFHEDIGHRPVELLLEVAAFLGIDTYPTWPPADVGRPVFEGPGIPIRPPLLEHLVRVYRPLIDSLSDYLGRDLSGWYGRYPRIDR